MKLEAYFTPFKPAPVVIPPLPKTEREALMYSVRQGYQQLFMHKESGDIFIFWPKSIDSTFSRDYVEHKYRYALIGEHPGMIADMYGDPMVHGFEWLGEYAHCEDPYA